MKQSSLNNLADVYALYNDNGDELDKSERDIFVTGTMSDVRDNFQVSSCAWTIQCIFYVPDVKHSSIGLWLKWFRSDCKK